MIFLGCCSSGHPCTDYDFKYLLGNAQGNRKVSVYVAKKIRSMYCNVHCAAVVYSALIFGHQKIGFSKLHPSFGGGLNIPAL